MSLSLGRVLGHKGPTESVFFVWKTAWRKILTYENFRRKGGEGVDHLLNHCTEAYQLWCFVFRSFGISWVLPKSVKDLLFGWWNWMGKHSLDIGIWFHYV